jgi:hypothetical protein
MYEHWPDLLVVLPVSTTLVRLCVVLLCWKLECTSSPPKVILSDPFSWVPQPILAFSLPSGARLVPYCQSPRNDPWAAVCSLSISTLTRCPWLALRRTHACQMPIRSQVGSEDRVGSPVPSDGCCDHRTREASTRSGSEPSNAPAVRARHEVIVMLASCGVGHWD